MNFNEALQHAADLAKAHLADLQEDVFLVRDLNGRIRVLLQSPDPGARPKKPFKDALKALAQELPADLGGYAYPKKALVIFHSDIPSFTIPASAPVLREEAGHKIRLLDRLLMGGEWSAPAVPENPSPRRFTLYSMKGGVGRSTTAAVLAWHLAKKGKRVLVLDMDLESPGVGKTLLGPSLPQFGLVDWFVEDALGQGDAVLHDLVVESPLGVGTGGWIGVAPAYGNGESDYLAKLGRAYLERGAGGPEPWPKRLERLVKALELQETPDVVLLDSRTGLHDASAALVLAMGAHTLVFAVDTTQTWSAYGFLFQHWAGHPDVASFYDKLWVVGTMVPDTEIDSYLDGLRDRSWTLFDETFYAAPRVANQPGFVTPVVADEAGNHFPRPVFWQRGLMAFDPLANWTEHIVTAAYQGFLDWFDRVLLEEPEAP